MENFVPFEKLSKKKQKELNAMKRRGWNGINPVTRKPANPKAYKIKRHRTEANSILCLFIFEFLKVLQAFLPLF